MNVHNIIIWELEKPETIHVCINLKKKRNEEKLGVYNFYAAIKVNM